MRIARLHLVTPEPLDGAAIAATGAALAAGARWVQVRIKTGCDRARLAAACAAVAQARGHGATALVNDRVDLALAAGADGVHLGLDDLPVAAARGLVPDGFVVGATVRDAEQARRAEGEGATYLGVGPVYATATKDGLPAPMGPAGLAAVVGATTLPVVAISGITVDRIPEVLAAGAHGVAVVGAVYGRDDPGAATAALLGALVTAAR